MNTIFKQAGWLTRNDIARCRTCAGNPIWLYTTGKTYAPIKTPKHFALVCPNKLCKGEYFVSGDTKEQTITRWNELMGDRGFSYG
jgi:hypothetical protein